ncbi:hypothetical protein [Cupriavidus sp. 8B]
MATVQPDYQWNKSISAERSVAIRCPLANVHKCPRYYESLSLLGGAGITTSIAKDKDQALLDYWKNSEYWSVVEEHATSITSRNNEHSGFHNFCPEISFDVFHLFASYLHRFPDEIDRQAAFNQLSTDPTQSANDWRWNWQYVDPLHYTECPVYAMLSDHEGEKMRLDKKDEVLQLRPSIYGFSVDLKALWRKALKWFKSRN